MNGKSHQERAINKSGCVQNGAYTDERHEREKTYLQKLSDKLIQQKTELDKLKAKINAAKEDIRMALLKEIENLRAKKEVAKGKIKQLQEAGDDMWDDVKAGVENSWSELRAAFSKVYSTLKSSERTTKP